MYEKRNIPLAPGKHFFCPTDTEKPALPPPQGENKAGLPNAAENLTPRPSATGQFTSRTQRTRFGTE